MHPNLTTHRKRNTSRARASVLLALLALLIPVIAGCGGGGDKEKTGKGASTTKSGTQTNKRKAPVGGAVQGFQAKVVSPTQAQLTITLTKAGRVAVSVRRISGTPAKLGNVTFGNKPKGRSVINWDLKVKGKKLTAGKYRLILRAGKGAGKSKPVEVTVP